MYMMWRKILLNTILMKEVRRELKDLDNVNALFDYRLDEKNTWVKTSKLWYDIKHELWYDIKQTVCPLSPHLGKK